MTNNDLISRAAAIAEIEEYIEEYSELEPETGYHNLKWCSMSEAKEVLTMLPAVDAIPVKWLRDLQHRAMVGGYTELEGNIMMLLREWQQEIGEKMDGGPDA